MAAKKRKSLQQMQREKLKAQRKAKASKGGALAKRPTPQKALPPGKKGGKMVKSSAGKVVKSSAGKLAKVAGGAGKALGGAALIASGAATAKNLSDSLKRGEGYASLGKLNKKLQKNSGGGRSGAKRRQAAKPKKESKPTKVTSNKPTNRRGRVTGPAPSTPKPRGMSNIPPKEGTGKGSPNDKPTPKATKPTPSKPSRPSSTPSRAPAASKTPAKKSATSTYNKHGSKLHIGRYKTLKEHRAAVAERKKKK